MKNFLSTKKLKLTFSSNNTNYKTLSHLTSNMPTKPWRLRTVESNKQFDKNNLNTLSPFITSNYYKDPFFFNEKSLKTQINILRSIHDDKYKIKKEQKSFPQRNIFQNLGSLKSPSKIKTLQNDDFFFKNVFKSKPLFKKLTPIIDNKLNLRYAENEDQYIKIVEREQKQMLLQGKKIKKRNTSENIKIKIKEIQKRIRFMKGIMDFSYPEFVLTKIKAIDKRIKDERRNSRNMEFYTPVEMRNLSRNFRNNQRKKYLSECIAISISPF